MVANKKVVIAFVFILSLQCSIKQQAFAQNGITPRYTNPIIHQDYSDPDVIRVGNWFYMTASSFTSVPGLPILRSSDLVHWQLIGYALKNNIPAAYYKQVHHGAGVWAPSIRFHNGEFYIYYPDPDMGIYMTKTKDILGNWSEPKLVLEGKGLIDPCPLWDDNGKVYLVHAFAGSRAGIKSILVMKELNSDGTKLVDEGKLIYDGHAIDPTVEGPKMYKRNGWYYIFAPAGGVPTGWQIVLRSKNIYGPYERKKVMEQGPTLINGPHQGAWVQTNTGEDWFIHFQDKEAYGRITHLQPMAWIKDWPVIGEDKDGDGIGNPVTTYKMPTMLNAAIPFVENEALDFQWNATPSFNWRMPYLNEYRNYAILNTDTFPNLWNFPAMYLRKLPAENFVYTSQIHFNSLQIGERAGFLVFGKSYAGLELKNTGSGLQLNYVECNKADKASPEIITNLVSNANNTIFIRITMISDAVAHFSYSFDETNFTNVSASFKATPGIWVGAKMGFYCSSARATNDAGYMEIKSTNLQNLTK